jgi:hypothetical protein
MGAIFDDTQTKRLKERNLSMFDMIYINGVSAAELYGDKYNNMSRQSRSAMIKAEIISAMVNDKAKIDVTPIMIDKDGREKVTPLSIKPSVKEIQPTLNPFKRFVNGLCSPFGKPFKTEEEKLVIANDTPGHDKDLRLAEAIRPVQEKVTRAAVESLNRQLDELKRNPTPYLQISRDFDKGFNRERTSLCKALYGEQYENTAHLGDTTHVRLERGGVNIGAAMLFANGHSFDDILDPDKLKDEKREAGKQLVELLRLGKSDDPEKQKKSKEGIADVYLRYAERYSKLDMLPIDHTDPAQLAANRRELIGRGLIACDISQEIAQVKDTVIGLTGKSRYDKLGDAMAYNGMLYNTLESSVRNAAAALDAPAEATRIKAAQESAKGIYMRDKIGLLFNGNKDAKVGDINGFNTARETYNFVAFLGASGEMGDSSVQNGNFHKIVMNLCHNRNVMVVDGAKNTLRSDFESGVSLTAPELGAAQNREAVRYDDLDQRQHTTSRERVAASPQLQMNTPQM